MGSLEKIQEERKEKLEGILKDQGKLEEIEILGLGDIIDERFDFDILYPLANSNNLDSIFIKRMIREFGGISNYNETMVLIRDERKRLIRNYLNNEEKKYLRHHFEKENIFGTYS